MPHIQFTKHSPDGLEFHFQDWRPESEPAAVICLVHGLGEHSGRYEHVAAALNQVGYALLGFDLRGHGKTAGLRGHAPSIDTIMADIAWLLDEARARYPGKPLFLYGHSLGGLFVLTCALQREPSVAGIIASAPALRTVFPIPAAKLALGRVLYRVWPTFQMPNGLIRSYLSRDPHIVQAYNSDPLVHDRVSARLGLDTIRAGAWVLARSCQPTLPLLLMQGSEDGIVSAAATGEFAAGMDGNCTFKLWQGLYHEVHNEPEKEEVLRFMIDWIRRVQCPT